MKCTTPMTDTTPKTSLAAMAKISLDDARKQALAAVATKRHASTLLTIASEELEVEQKCLVYSFDIKVAGKAGVDEVFIDAGDGKVLLKKHETAKQEAAEKAKDAAKK